MKSDSGFLPISQTAVLTVDQGWKGERRIHRIVKVSKGWNAARRTSRSFQDCSANGSQMAADGWYSQASAPPI